MSACVRCQRDGAARARAEVVYYGLSLCYSHEIALRGDLDKLARLDDSDPEHAHGMADEVLLRWAPAPLFEAVKALEGKQPWWAGA